MLRLSSATAAARTATTGTAAPRNEILPVAAARRLGTAAANDADDAEPAADAARDAGIEAAAALSTNAMGVLTDSGALSARTQGVGRRTRGIGSETVTGRH
jgi:hypothetical protein